MNTFAPYHILGWAIDDFDQYFELIRQNGSISDINTYLDRYKNTIFNDYISKLFEQSPIKLNLGGESEKSKLIATERPNGIFDFSLASRGLYRVPEYYSQKLADENPDRFSGYDLPSGVVPPNFVTQTVLRGQKVFSFKDNGADYQCEIRQKGTAAIEQGLPNARLKYATRNKKVYLTYKRNRGKVKYVEIYSLFYYTSLNGDTSFAIRHIPAMMAADYLESIGIKVRFYMTRFVVLKRKMTLKARNQGVNLPMYDKVRVKNNDALFVQPIIAKEFGQEFDKALGLMTSSERYKMAYESLANEALKKETTSTSPDPYGNPDWCQNDYFEGFERYRNKYKEYVDQGIFKSKETTTDAMIFFHDMVIKTRFDDFKDRIFNYLHGNLADDLLNVNVNGFFVWWMKMSANVLKHKVNILNSDDYKKDLAEIEKDLLATIEELEVLLRYVDPNIGQGRNQSLLEYLTEFGNRIMGETEGACQRGFGGIYGYNIKNSRGQITFRTYVLNITDEITTYADGGLYETTEEQKEYRNNILMGVINALSDFSYTI